MCKTYRDIAILNIAYKILAIISNEINKIVEKGKESNGSNFVLNELQTESYEHQLDINILFISL